MDPDLLKILVVEDDQEVASVLGLLLRTRFSADVTVAGDCACTREQLSGNEFDLVTLDFQLPDGNGIELLREITSSEEHPPVIMVTGHGSEQTAVNAFKYGASGYVLKDARMSTLLALEVNSALAKIALKRAEQDLKESEERYRQIFENMSSGVAVYTLADDGGDFIFKEFNRAAERIDGVAREEVVGRRLTDVFPGVREFGLLEVLQAVARTGEPRLHPVAHYRDGRISGWRENYVYRLPSGEIVAVYDDRSRVVQAERDLEEREREILERFESLQDAVIWADTGTGLFVNCNDAAVALLETSKDDIIGRHQSTIHPPDKRELYEDLFRQHAERREVIGEEIEVITAGGDIKKVLLSSSVVSRGGRELLQGVFRDVTDRKLDEQKSKETADRFALLMRSTKAVLYISGAEPPYPATYVTENVRDISGYDSEDFLDEEFWFSHVHPDDTHVIERGIPLLLEKGSHSYDYRFLHRDGNYRWVHDEMTLVLDPLGNPREIVGFFIDITDRKKMEEELLWANRELEGYARTVSHDIRGPLSSALVCCDLAADIMSGDSPDTESVATVRESMDIVHRSLKNSLSLVTDLLTFAEAGHAPELVSEVEVSEVVERVLNELSTEIERREVRVRVSGDMGKLTANPAHVYQVFTNLMGNAIRHDDSPTPVLEVAGLGPDAKGGRRYLVRDNGSGIPPGDLIMLFEPFFERDGGGRGLGLSIVKRIIDLYQGEIKAYNDSGACFEFVLRGLA